MKQEKDIDNIPEEPSPGLTPEQRARVLRFRERIYPESSPEEKERLLRCLKEWLEEGCCQRKMEPSLLGLDWSSFETRKFPEHDGETGFRNPPEFISCGFSALDAYATAMLAAHFSSDSLGVLTFTCKLKQRDPDSSLYLEFVTTPEHGSIDSESLMCELLDSFPDLLDAKTFPVLFLAGEGCPMACEYPGQMVARVSPFLRARPVELWPEAMLSLTPAVDLRRRAKQIVAFLRDSKATGGIPN